MIDRRTFCASLATAALAGWPTRAAAQRLSDFTMWHSPGCGCCLEWAPRVEALFRRPVHIVESNSIEAVKRVAGVPRELWSCHTAVIAGVRVEGHVPPADIRRLAAGGNPERFGLAVPGMPAGSPGMDVGHDRREPFSTIAFNGRGRRVVFARHNGR